jgi:hypothetical protein
MKKPDQKLKVIVFKACVAAVWSDSSMSSEEQRYLSHLTEVLADSENQRNTLREIRLDDLNEGLVLSEIAQLDKQEKEYVFDTCLSVLVSDKRIVLHELKFLNSLRKTCGIGFWSYRKKLSSAKKKAKARIYRNRWNAVLGLLAVCILYAIGKYGLGGNAALEEKSNKKEVVLSILGPNDLAKSTLKTGDEVFKFVRNSIVSVKVFTNNKTVCTGSGSVIGWDETGIIYIITNKHVIQNQYIKNSKSRDRLRVEVQQHSGARFYAALDFYSRKHDIALLAVKGMDKYTQPLKLSLKSSLKVGQPVYAVGNPIGLKDTFTAGIISALRDSYLQTDATVYYGSSGGPLIDQHGALCAVVTTGHKVKNFSFALYSDAILDVLKERREKLNKKQTDI